MTKSTSNGVEQGYVRPAWECPGGTASRRAGFLSTVLLAASACFGILILIKVACFFSTWANEGNLLGKDLVSGQPDANGLHEHIAKSRAIADELTKRNLFAPLPPKPHPVTAVAGILGNEVLIDHKWYKIGDTIADAKVVAIEPTSVLIEWQGTEKEFSPMRQSSLADSGSSGAARRRIGQTTRQQPIAAAGAAMVVVGSQRTNYGSTDGFRKTRQEEKAKLAAGMREGRKLPAGKEKMESAKAGVQSSAEKLLAKQNKALSGRKTKAAAENSKSQLPKGQNRKSTGK